MESEDLKNKLCMVTGANSGIGKATAMRLSSRGAYIVMVCRNEERAEQARNDIIDRTGNTGIDILYADFTHQFEIRKLAERFLRDYDQLDILVNNAGMLGSKRKETVDGVEKTFAVNHLGPFLLTNLLHEALVSAPAARVINVASEVHRLGARVFDFENLQLEEGYTPLKAYGVSKLCNIMFTWELARRTSNTGITTFSLHPGTVRSQLAEEASLLMKMAFFIGKPFMRSPHKAAETPVYLATADEVLGKNGRYFKDKKELRPASPAYDENTTRRLWEISKELTELEQGWID